MSKRQAGIILHQINRLSSPPVAGSELDRQLLERFLDNRDEAAFATLLDRHGAMVLRLCRRILHDAHEAEDAFQATFLVLARKAGTVRKQQSLGSWLYRVAYHVAIRARAVAARREEIGARRPRPATVDPLAEVSGRELLSVLDEELQRLPEKYRAPLVLCYLEGHTQDEAARQLGWRPQVLRGRIDRGRAVLRRRLIRRGFGLSAVLAGSLLEQMPAPAAAPALLIARTIRAAVCSSIEQPAIVSSQVAALVESGISSLGATKSKFFVVLLLILGVVTAGGGIAALQKPTGNTEKLQAGRPPENDDARQKSAATTRNDRMGDPLPAGAVARLGTNRLRHAAWISSAAYSPDGKFLASGGADERVRVWDAETGKELRHYHLVRKGQGAMPINGVAFSPNGKLLAAVGWGTAPCLWDVASGKALPGVLDNERYVVFSPDSRTVVTGSMPNHGVHLLELQTNQSRGISVGLETIHAVAFSPDGKMLAGADSKNRVSLWDAVSLKELRCLRGHENEVCSLDFSPDGKQIVTGGMDKTIRLWDVAAGKEIRRIQAPSLVDGVRYSPDGKMIAARSDGRIILWNAQSGKLMRQFADCYGGGFSYPIAFSPDGKRLLGVQGNALQVWETATGKVLFPASAIREGIVRIAYSGSGRTLATASEEGTIRLWDRATYRELRRFGGRQPIIHSLSFSADGRLVAAAGQDKTTRLWDAKTGKELFRWETDINDGFDSVFTPDGRVLASCNGDASIQLWSTETGKPLLQLKGHAKGAVYCIAFSPDGKTMISGGYDKTLRFWDWSSGRELRVLAGHTDWVMAVDFSPDGQTLASAAGSGDKFIRLWDVKTGKELRRFEAQEPGLNTAIYSLAFSPDGRMIASAGFGGTIHLWEVATGKERCCFRGHDHRIAKVVFSPDGRLLASTGDDSTVLFWDVTGRHLDTQRHPQRLTRPEWEDCWRDLADSDAQRAYRALHALVADPEQSVTRFKQRIGAVRGPIRSGPPS